MAVWQYDLIAVPRDVMVARLGRLPIAVSVAEMNSLRAWADRQPHIGFQDDFSRWRPKAKSWSQDLLIWGSEESNRIDVSVRAGRVEHIEFRVEIRSLNINFIETIAVFCRRSNCVLVSAHSLSVIDPLRQNILMYLCRCHGANSVWDWLLGAGESAINRPRLFLSHSSADKAFVDRLATDLKADGTPVWYDKWELKVGDSLHEKIEEGISDSAWLAVVLSEHSVNSDWVQRELRAAQAKELRDKNVFVLPLLLDDCTIPLFLLDKLYADFRTSYANGLAALHKRILEGTDL